MIILHQDVDNTQIFHRPSALDFSDIRKIEQVKTFTDPTRSNYQ